MRWPLGKGLQMSNISTLTSKGHLFNTYNARAYLLGLNLPIFRSKLTRVLSSRLRNSSQGSCVIDRSAMSRSSPSSVPLLVSSTVSQVAPADRRPLVEPLPLRRFRLRRREVWARSMVVMLAVSVANQRRRLAASRPGSSETVGWPFLDVGRQQEKQPPRPRW